MSLQSHGPGMECVFDTSQGPECVKANKLSDLCEFLYLKLLHHWLEIHKHTEHKHLSFILSLYVQ